MIETVRILHENCGGDFPRINKYLGQLLEVQELQDILHIDVALIYRELRELISKNVGHLAMDIRSSSSYKFVQKKLWLLEEMCKQLQSHLIERDRQKFAEVSSYVRQQVGEEQNAIKLEISRLKQDGNVEASGVSIVDSLALRFNHFSKVGHLYKNTPLYTDVVAMLERVVSRLGRSVVGFVEASPYSPLAQLQLKFKILMDICYSRNLMSHVSRQVEVKFDEVKALLNRKYVIM